MTDYIEIENRAALARTTCGWPLAKWQREAVRPFWREVHSPAISRRAGIYQYRHSPFDPVRGDLFAPLPGVEQDCPVTEQIQWQSDVVYLDESGLGEFSRSPEDPAVTALLLTDIEMLVDKSTTYRAVGDNLHTYLDRTGDPTPLGPCPQPRYGVFFRSRADEATFRQGMRALAERWSDASGILRVRMNLFDVPDMEAERKAGYPVKTHPLSQQYQAWIDLVVQDDRAAARLISTGDADFIATVHAYPCAGMYTFVFAGPRLLEWMYGDVVDGAKVAPEEGSA